MKLSKQQIAMLWSVGVKGRLDSGGWVEGYRVFGRASKATRRHFDALAEAGLVEKAVAERRETTTHEVNGESWCFVMARPEACARLTVPGLVALATLASANDDIERCVASIRAALETTNVTIEEDDRMRSAMDAALADWRGRKEADQSVGMKAA